MLRGLQRHVSCGFAAGSRRRRKRAPQGWPVGLQRGYCTEAIAGRGGAVDAATKQPADGGARQAEQASRDERAQQSSTAAPEPPPSRRVKFRHFIACAMPMVGFGIMDNTIMIHAGDLIDQFFGQYLRFTLIAAAFGQ
eukprot:gene15095-23058_t